jgi:peptide/nickel transport system substrate-binding protein
VREGFEYPFSPIDPVGGAHIDPPSVAIYETLLRKGPGGVALPGLAQSWSIAEDGLSWQLRLRPGATFHSGQPCDARAVAAALHGCRWGADPTRQVWYWDAVDEVRVVDSTTLEFTLHFPYSRLPTLLWGTHTAIHNEASRLANGADYGVTIVDGTGPYRLQSWALDQVSAVRVGDDSGRPARITWVSLTDDDARRAAARSGELSVLRCPPPGLWAELGGPASGWRQVELPQDSNAYLALNFAAEQFDFHRVEMRRAISSAIDRPRLVGVALGGHGQPTLGPIPPQDPYYRLGDPALVGAAAPDRAAAELDRLGWTQGADGRRQRDGRPLAFHCVTQDDQAFRRMAELIVEDLARIGVGIDFEFVAPFQPFYDACEAGPESLMSKWLWQDPMEAIIGFSASWCDGGPNWQHARVPELDRTYGDWLRADTPAAFDQAATAVQTVFASELPYIPLVTPTDTWLIRNELPGYTPVAGILYPEYGSSAVRVEQ